MHKRIASTSPAWDLYNSFLAVMRLGSLSAAARALDTTQPTLGRHIEALEEQLGTRLFTRSTAGLTPNAMAQELLPHAEAMAAAADALVRTASGEAAEECGTVRITASEVIGSEVLPAMLASFRAQHTRIALELALTNETEDLLRRDADIAIRMFRPTQNALIAVRIGTVELGLYAHRRYVEANGLPRNLEEIQQHALIGYDRKHYGIRVAAAVGIPVRRDSFNIRCDNELTQLSTLRAGLGITACQKPLAARNPDLVPVLPKAFSFKLEMWLAMHEDMRQCHRVTLLFDHLTAQLRNYCRLQPSI